MRTSKNRRRNVCQKRSYHRDEGPSGRRRSFFFSRGGSFRRQWYHRRIPRAILKTVKGTLRCRRDIIIPLEASETSARTERADHLDVNGRIVVIVVTVSSSSFSTISVSRGARGTARFTIHKTTRRIELSSLALRQLPAPFATGRAARICIIPFASTILIGGLFQSLSLRIFAFALLYLPRPACLRSLHPSLPPRFRYPVPAALPPRRSLKLWSSGLFLSSSPSMSLYCLLLRNLLSAFTLSSLSPSRDAERIK